MVWLRDTGKKVVALVSTDGSEVDQFTISASTWSTLLEKVRVLSLKLPTCKSDLTISDGSSYFGSLDLDGSTSQFAVYGLNFFPDVTPTQREYTRQMAPCKIFVDEVFRTVGLRAAPRIAARGH